MTAVVGILNKTTVALAADSAATITGPHGDKVYNHAHKLFNLSSHHPVGIMIYSSSELVGLPWETLIKVHRKKLGTRAFATLPKYADHFIEELSNYIPFMSREDMSAQVEQHILKVWEVLWDDFSIYLEKNGDASTFNRSTIQAKNLYVNTALKDAIIPKYNQQWSQSPVLPGLEAYSHDNYMDEYGKAVVSTLLSKLESIDFEADDDVLTEIVNLAFTEITHQVNLDPWTGVVISGFGDAELFPRLVSYRVGPLLGGILRIFQDNKADIKSNNGAAIMPYAQTHDMYSFLTGVDPVIRSAVESGADTAFEEFIDSVVDISEDTGHKETLRTLFSGLKKTALDNLYSSIDQVSQRRHIQPILSSIALSSKEELAEMAESLVNVTSLKRKFSFATESVGGPVDVAVITKGEGFIWLKRKQYFKPELNLNYISSVINRLANGSNTLPPSDHEPDPIELQS